MARRHRRGRTDNLLQGVLLVDKPADITSREVCQRVQHRLRLGKVGHGGTLDPFATGLLPLLLNGATRLMPQLQNRDKGYEARVRLGTRTDTMDPTGEVIQEQEVHGITDDAVGSAAAEFVGELRQQVPRYSAARVNGKRLYEYARAGEEVELPYKDVVVHRVEVQGIERSAEHIDVLIDVDCSSGTYVRAIADELGQKLGCGAHLFSLRRTRISNLKVTQGVHLDAIQAQAAQAVAERKAVESEGEKVPFVAESNARRWRAFFGEALIPVAQLLSLPSVRVPPAMAERLRTGAPVRKSDVDALGRIPQFGPGDQWVLEDEEGLRGIAVVRAAVARDSLVRREPRAVVFQVERLLR